MISKRHEYTHRDVIEEEQADKKITKKKENPRTLDLDRDTKINEIIIMNKKNKKKQFTHYRHTLRASNPCMAIEVYKTHE